MPNGVTGFEGSQTFLEFVADTMQSMRDSGSTRAVISVPFTTSDGDMVDVLFAFEFLEYVEHGEGASRIRELTNMGKVTDGRPVH